MVILSSIDTVSALNSMKSVTQILTCYNVVKPKPTYLTFTWQTAYVSCTKLFVYIEGLHNKTKLNRAIERDSLAIS